MEDNRNLENSELDINDNPEIEEEEKSNKSGFLTAFIILMLLIPLLIILVLYNVNPKFRGNLDSVFHTVGEQFKDKNNLTPEERKARVEYLANYYTSVDEPTAVDKLYIIKQDDSKLYEDIISLMSKKDSNKTKNIVAKVRDKELNKDLLVENYEEAVAMENDADAQAAKALESMDLILAKKELSRLRDEPNFKDVINLVNPERLAEILYYMPSTESLYVLGDLEDKKAQNVRNAMDALELANENLIATAGILDKRPTAEAIAYLDNRPEISARDMAVIMENMSLPKAAEIAAGLEDRQRLDETFYQMSMLERLLGKEEGRASDISELVDYVTEYNKKIDDLVNFYKKVDPKKTATIFEKLINNNKDVTVLSVTDPSGIGKKIFKTTDRKVALDIAQRMKPKTVSEVISEMDVGVAALFTELLAHPDRTITHEGNKALAKEGEEGEIINDTSKISLNVDFHDDDVYDLNQEFKQRAKDLAKAFDKMPPEELSKIVRGMLAGTDKNKQTLANILSNIKPDTMSNLLDSLSQGDRTTLSNIMATGDVETAFQTDSREAADAVAAELAKVYDEMDSVALATLIKRTVDDAYDYEDTQNLESLVIVLSKVKEDSLAKALDLLNPDMSGEITDLIYKYRNSREVNE